MAYYIKTLGIKNRPVSIFKDRYPRMLLSQMCFKTKEGKVAHIKKGDALVIYCLRNAFKEFPHGGFIGIQDVLSPMYEDPTLFGESLQYVVDVHPRMLWLRSGIRLKEVTVWKHVSTTLRNALKANLQAIGGLLDLEHKDYRLFVRAFQERLRKLDAVKKERQMFLNP